MISETRHRHRIAIVAFFLLLAVAVGCKGGIAPSQAAATQGALDRGLAAFEQQNWAEAEKELTAAIDGAGLSPDLFEQALLSRARARVHSGNLDDASSDLTQLAQGAAAMDQVWAARCELELKRGDKAAAAKAFQEARKLNPRMTPPANLK